MIIDIISVVVGGFFLLWAVSLLVAYQGTENSQLFILFSFLLFCIALGVLKFL